MNERVVWTSDKANRVTHEKYNKTNNSIWHFDIVSRTEKALTNVVTFTKEANDDEEFRHAFCIDICDGNFCSILPVNQTSIMIIQASIFEIRKVFKHTQTQQRRKYQHWIEMRMVRVSIRGHCHRRRKEKVWSNNRTSKSCRQTQIACNFFCWLTASKPHHRRKNVYFENRKSREHRIHFNYMILFIFWISQRRKKYENNVILMVQKDDSVSGNFVCVSSTFFDGWETTVMTTSTQSRKVCSTTGKFENSFTLLLFWLQRNCNRQFVTHFSYCYSIENCTQRNIVCVQCRNILENEKKNNEKLKRR